MLRRSSLKTLLAVCIASCSIGSPLLSFVVDPQASNPNERTFLIGGFADGIYASKLNLVTGEMSKPTRLAEVFRPAFFCFHPTLDVLYCVTETNQADPEHPAMLTSFLFDKEKTSLKKLNAQPVAGDIPCYVSTDLEGSFAMVANYTSGSVAIYPISRTGELLEASDRVEHQGTIGPNKARQEKAHAHCILPDPSGKWVVAADLGVDQVKVYRIDTNQKKLVPAPTPAFTLPPGSGPRHVRFHPDGKLAFIINELGSTLTSALWDDAKGTFSLVQTISTLPANSTASGNTTAEVLVHPNGKFVYGSNRGDDSIAAFRVDESTGKMVLIGHCASGGKTPRNFRIDPTGQYLLAENQGSDTIFSLKIDQATGALTQTGHSIAQPAPACIKFVR